ncbi:MAG: phosphopentomutase [Balneolaceae bacterium]
MSNVYLVIIDGLGIGAQEDADKYGDEAANTLAKVSKKTGVKLPNFEKLGLGNIIDLHSISNVRNPLASWGKMREVSGGKDSTTGHWEIAGIHLQKPFPTYPEGFPEQVIQLFCKETDVEGVLCNLPYSGTRVIADYGDEHMETGRPIVYTSADSVFQIACHTDRYTIDEQYRLCEIARNRVMIGEHLVGRVIARPFKGSSGNFERISEKRHDYSAMPPEPNLLSLLNENDIKVYSIGKIIDLFANRGFTQYRRTKSNAEGISQLLSLMSANPEHSFVFINLIDTDQIYGHRQDPHGYAECLQEIDRALPAIIEKLNDGDLLMITSDHGNDPCDDSTDHTREFVPLLVIDKQQDSIVNLGTRETFSDISASVLHFFKIKNTLPGTSFLNR